MVIDGAIQVAAYLHKNEDLRIDQALKAISICLPSLISFTAPLHLMAGGGFQGAHSRLA